MITQRAIEIVPQGVLTAENAEDAEKYFKKS